MSKGKEIWNTKENAEAYDAYARRFPMCRDTSRDLVDISGIKSGMTIVDLAAGTGATTQAIIEKVAGTVRIIAVDQAEEMLKKAKQKCTGGNVLFIVSSAENLEQVISEPVDAVICNSAFWQMKPHQVFKSVSTILKQGGIFAFNLPDSFFSHTDFKKQPINSAPYSTDDLTLWGKEVGLTLVTESVKAYRKTFNEVVAFNEIPVMKRNFKTEDEKNQFIARLREETTKNISQRQWVYFVFKKK